MTKTQAYAGDFVHCRCTVRQMDLSLPPVKQRVSIESPPECMSEFDQTLVDVWKTAHDLSSQKKGQAGAFSWTGKEETGNTKKI